MSHSLSSYRSIKLNTANIPCRGVSHTPECANSSTKMFSGRMRYAPTQAILRIRYLFVELCVRCDEMFLIYDFKTHEHGIVFLDGAETVE